MPAGVCIGPVNSISPGDLKTRKSTGTSCQIKRNIIFFVSKFLANVYFSLLSIITNFQQVS